MECKIPEKKEYIPSEVERMMCLASALVYARAMYHFLVEHGSGKTTIELASGLEKRVEEVIKETVPENVRPKGMIRYDAKSCFASPSSPRLINSPEDLLRFCLE